MPELAHVGDDFLLCLQLHIFVASVVVQCRANVEALLCYVGPGLARCGFAWISTLQPTGAKGVSLKSNGPLKYSQADIFGLIVAWHSKLTVDLAWGVRRSQRYGRNAVSTPVRMERKWFLKCCIICLALFLRCISSGTS